MLYLAIELFNTHNIMRRYTEKEQFYIKQLVDNFQFYDRYLALNLFDPILNGNGNTISLDLANGKMLFYMIHGREAAWIDDDKCYRTLDTELFLEIESKVVELLILIKDLIDNRLIYFLDEGNSELNDDILFKVEEGRYHIQKTLDKKLVPILSDCAFKPVLCLPELISLKENNFIPEEDRRHAELIEQKQKEMEQMRQLNIENLAAAEKRNNASLAQQKEIADDNLAAARKSNKTAIKIAIFSALATGLLSALIAQFIPMSIKEKQINDIIMQLNEPVLQLDSIVEQCYNSVKDDKIDTLQLSVKKELMDISIKMDKIINDNKKRKLQ